MNKACLTLLLALLATAAEAQVKGTIHLKIQPEFEPQLTQTPPARPAAATPGLLQVGVQRFDAVSARFGARTLRRLFPDAGAYEALHREAGLHLWYELAFDAEADLDTAVTAYGRLAEVAHAGKVYPVRRITGVTPAGALTAQAAEAVPAPAATAVNDPLFTQQWHYHYAPAPAVDINLPEAWDYTMGSAEVIVAVVDGGIDVNHPDLAGALWRGLGKNFVTSGRSLTPDDHGTHVAGVVGALTGNGTGGAGIAGGPGDGSGVRLMSCQIFEGDRFSSRINQAIVYAADSGAVICQNSWGYENPGEYNAADSVALRYFVTHAGKRADGSPRPGTKMNGGIVIFAAGNEESNARWYPACFDFVTAVAAVGYTGRHAYYTNYGTWVDLAAPGGDADNGLRKMILSTVPTASTYAYREGTGYGWMQGTSMACPHVSGVAALVLAKYGHPDYTPAMLRDRLLDSTRSLAAFDPTYAPLLGRGLLDAQRALSGSVIHASGVVLNACLAERSVGDAWPLKATVLPETAINKSVTFTSSDPAVVAISYVDGQPVATAHAPGEALLTVTTADGGLQDVCRVAVVIPVDGITLTPPLARLQMGDVLQLVATITPADAGNKRVVWHSDNPGVALLGSDGRLTVVAGGSVDNPKKATITATTANGSYTAAAEILAYGELYAPEAFTPNGDGVNDRFVCALNPHDSYALTVFDRAGQVHFRAADYRNDWDGTAGTGPHAGNRLPAGTYLYILSAKKSGQVKKDFVVIKY
jgi:gliding motility-associated-like protein